MRQSAVPHVWVLSDDIYEKLIYTEKPFSNILNAAPDLHERTLIINGVSKVYAMTGWRIGYAAGPLALLRAMNLVQGQIITSAASVSQYAALEALTGEQSFVRRSLESFRERKRFVVEALNGIAGLQCTQPDGAFYAFAGCRDLLGRSTPGGKRIERDVDLVMYLLDEANVALVSGSGFLLSPYFRLSYAASFSQLGEAMKRIGAACAKLRN